MRYVPARPYSLRLDASTIRRLEEEAGRARVRARTLAQELVDEGLRMRRHPIVRFVDRAAGRRAALVRRPRLSVANVVETVRVSSDLDEAARYLHLDRGELDQVLDYYVEFRGEIDAEIARMHEFAAREHRLWRERQGALER